ncbi:MAG: fatty acid desaturase [Gammaproteobacteria bacterium]|nr:fatty acid desaturase [Gammaproteobacteria bacterium]
MTTYSIPSPSEQSIPQTENFFKFVLLMVLLQASFYVTDYTLDHFALQWAAIGRMLFIGSMAVMNGFLIIGLGVLAHDAVHKVLFRNLTLNEWVGGIATGFVMVPFYANRQFHLTHHRYAHQPELDPENEMHSPSFWYAATIGATMGLYLQYKIFFIDLFTRLFDARYTGALLKDITFLLLAAGFYFILPTLWGVNLLFTSVATLLTFPLVFSYRALSDHYGIPAVARKSQQREYITDGTAWYSETDPIKVTGWVVLTHPWLEWLWSSVNYHEVHHKYPYLSHQHLKTVFENTRSQVPYMVINGYSASLWNLYKRPYYESPEQAQTFLTVKSN